MKKLTSVQIRQMWLDFFKSKGHKVEPGASLIPHNDPTLLWINSGVAALKKYFDGSEVPPSKRITNVQKSIRTNDIENVGHTARHHTFFEMLGNFSIGDYFRKEVVPWAYEILTSPEWFAIDKEKLYVTYFPTDLETRKLWIDSGLSPDHLIPLEHNFWQIGEGPCGPNTEVFFDRGEKWDPDHIGIKLLSEEIENDRYIEIWGIVFSQFNAVEGVEKEKYKELPSKNIDTGAGLERICCVLQGTETNFETDLFMPIIKATEKLAKLPYEGKNKVSYRVIADHARACTFAISDGESFSNEGRGYVLRRLVRRAMRYGQKIGINKPFLYTLVPVVIDVMKSYYPELIKNKEKVQKMIEAEEVKFLKTLDNGEAILRKMVEGQKILTGENAFKLYDTFGFPIELTQEICLELDVAVDMDGFKKEMKHQKEMARAARGGSQSMSSQSKDLIEFTTKSEFTYGFEPIKAKVVGLFKDGKKVDTLTDSGEVIFDKTIFYAESGGQVCDSGTIKNKSTTANVTKVIKAPNKQHLHVVDVLFGQIEIGDTFLLEIDELRRLKIMRNHSATHLLQAALDEILGEEINQAGSAVNDEYVHFDFNYNKKIDDESLTSIEKKVNSWIAMGIKGKTEILPIEEAKKIGAKALFDEKYGDFVRVVSFGEVSKEFCGGTHVTNTQDIGIFVIEFEESVASGTRRIQFRTSEGAYELIKYRENILSRVKNKIGASSLKEIDLKLGSLLDEKEKLNQRVSLLNQRIANNMSESLKKEFTDVNGKNILVKYLPNVSRETLLLIIDSLKTIHENSIVVLIGSEEETLPIAVSSKIKDLSAGKMVGMIAKELGGSGGGRPDFASGAGKDASKIDSAIKLVKEMVK
ncbi:MAG: alanine--tRNA ligase [Erysipelotrichaceae bacterium]|nr:alanine--tRNA ligase [Erysipelotrichaceae bacterium]